MGVKLLLTESAEVKTRKVEEFQAARRLDDARKQALSRA